MSSEGRAAYVKATRNCSKAETWQGSTGWLPQRWYELIVASCHNSSTPLSIEVDQIRGPLVVERVLAALFAAHVEGKLRVKAVKGVARTTRKELPALLRAFAASPTVAEHLLDGAAVSALLQVVKHGSPPLRSSLESKLFAANAALDRWAQQDSAAWVVATDPGPAETSASVPGPLSGGLWPCLVVIDDEGETVPLGDVGTGFEIEVLTPHADGVSEEGRVGGRARLRAVLDVGRLEALRQRTAAFLVDVNWGERGMQEMGASASGLLRTLFPEIPVFAFTGHRDPAMWREALARGAKWVFLKGWEGFTGYVPPAMRLDRLAIEQAIERFHSAEMGAPERSPFEGQLVLLPGSPVAAEVRRRLEGAPGLVDADASRAFKSLIATAFPRGESVEPIKVPGGGRSGVDLVAFARIDEGRRATRLLKFGPWKQIWREAFAYEAVVAPKIGSYVASAVGKPGFCRRASGVAGDAWGLLVYTTAGSPEAIVSIDSLDDMLRAARDTGFAEARRRTIRTLRSAVRVLHSGRSGLWSRATRPVYSWLGDVLPAVITGRLVATTDVKQRGTSAQSFTLQGRPDLRLTKKVGWWVAAREFDELWSWVKSCDDRKAGPRLVAFDEFLFDEIKWGEDTAEAVLVHPGLGYRVKLRAPSADISERFGAEWIRPGMRVRVHADVDPTSRDESRLRDAVAEALRAGGKRQPTTPAKWLAAQLGEPCRCPFETLFGRPNGGGGRLPMDIAFEGVNGAVHGDLNLGNVLFTKDDPEGWLIDFERSAPDSLVAFDFAKLEVEGMNWHLFPAIQELAEALSGAAPVEKLAMSALRSLECRSSGEVFLLSLAKEFGVEPPPSQARTAAGMLDWIRDIRDAAEEEGCAADLRWALSAYAAGSCKFVNAQVRPLTYLASAWHLRRCLAPKAKIPKKDLKAPVPDGSPEVLSYLLDASSSEEIPLEVLVCAAAEGAPVDLKDTWADPALSSVRVRDLASTGGVANITPLVAYLWLAAQAAKQRNSGTASGVQDVVLKISSRGAGGGTVDTLEAAGAPFAASAMTIAAALRRTGAVLCSNEGWIPADRHLMAARKKHNLMISPRLVYASILGKKVAMGVTHAAIDVKLGGDTKWLSRAMSDSERAIFLQRSIERLLPENIDSLVESLKRMGCEVKLETRTLPGGSSINCVVETFGNGKKHRKAFGRLQEVVWFATNGATAQCRAVGRELILRQLDEMFGQATTATQVFPQAHEDYDRLYLRVLPAVCGVDVSAVTLAEVRRAWTDLAGAFRRKVDLFRHRALDEEAGKSDTRFVIDEHADVAMIQFESRQTGTLKFVSAIVLDSLFSWLCGADERDTFVGIWLDRLPGEQAEKGNPLMKVYFRPSRHSVAEVRHAVRRREAELWRIE